MSSMSSRYALHNAMHHHGRGGGTWRGWGGTGGPGTSNNQLTGYCYFISYCRNYAY